MSTGVYRILRLNNIAAAGLDVFPPEQYTIGEDITDPDAILLRSANLHDATIARSVLAVARAGAGVNNIPVAQLSDRGVPVFNAPGANANAVKELVLAAMLLACRNLCQAWAYTARLDAGDDAALEEAVEAGKKRFAGYELPGRTLGVVGLGAIGVEVANAACALGMRVVGFDPTITVRRAWQLSAEVEQAMSVEQVVAEADFLTFHVPLLPSTRHLLDGELAERLRPGAVVLNFARQGIVDDAAVVTALRQGRLHAYVCDFPTRELRGEPGVITLPHLGASTAEAEANCAVMVARQLRAYLEDGTVENAVNFPAISLPRAGDERLVIVNQNRPDMVGQVSHLIGAANINIVHMVNESRERIACTIMDVDGRVPDDLVATLRRVPGVLSVREL